MFLASISSSFLFFQFNCSFWHCKCNCFSCCLWYYVVSSGGKLWRFRTSCCDCSSTTTLSSSLPFFMFSGFLETVNSPSFLRRLVALLFRQDRRFNPASRSRQLLKARSDVDQCPVTLRNWRIFWRIHNRSANRLFLLVIGCFANSLRSHCTQLDTPFSMMAKLFSTRSKKTDLERKASNLFQVDFVAFKRKLQFGL